MNLVYIMTASIAMAIFVPFVVDFLFLLNRMANFSPLKNNISHSNIYVFKKELLQIFAGKGQASLKEYGLYSLLLWLNFGLFFWSILIIRSDVSLGLRELQIFVGSLFGVALITAMVHAEGREWESFPEFLGKLFQKISSTALASAFIMISYQKGGAHGSSILFGLLFIFLLYFESMPGGPHLNDVRAFKRHCLSGSRIGLLFFSSVILISVSNISTRPDYWVYALVFCIGLDLILRVLSGLVPAFDSEMLERGNKAVHLGLIASIAWRLLF